jgi:heavy metal sensor kinase
MGIAGPLVLLIATAGGYLLAGRALAPVDAITTLASEVSAGDLHARLDLDLPDDELGRLARTFDAMLERIETSFERQRRFTSDAAHELRTPLATMRSQIDIILARSRAAGDYREAFQELDVDVERMTKLVAALLTLARSDSGQLPLERAPTDLAAIIAAVLGPYDQTARGAGLSLIDQSSSTECAVDRDLIIRLLINLLDNAIAHTPPGGRISVGCGVRDGRARLWVEDTGTGIPPEHQPHVFDRFYRVDPGRARAHGGTGLGLSIAQAIVEAHGGTISLESTPGMGTRVEAMFPV